MSDPLKEHRPLLREDNSDEEFQQDFSQPLRRPMGYRGRARNSVKGAAAIIKNWPDHWSSSVTQWWIGITMFALITFVFYNSVVAYSMIANADPIPRSVADSKVDFIEPKLTLPKVFMHIIVNNAKAAEINKYLPYIEIIANQYLHYKFNLIIIRNDTVHDEIVQQAQMNNEDALNSLWTSENIADISKISSKTKSNINIEYVNLSNYLNNSPIKQFWKQLPYQFMEFLVRAVSIWDKGGIAFSPVILTPKSPDGIYIEKLYSLLSSYEALKRPNTTKNVNRKFQNVEKNRKMNDKHKYKNRVNNIREIIDALETEPSGTDNISETLSEAENRVDLTELLIEPWKTESDPINKNISFSLTEDKVLPENVDNMSHKNDSIKSVETDDEHITLSNNRSQLLNIKLPSFLDFLFYDKSKTTQVHDSTDLAATGHSIKLSTRAAATESAHKNNENALQSMIIPAPNNFEKMSSKIEDNVQQKSGNLENLTIDLKGNILATRSACHAFLGTIFSNVKHRTDDESLKDFIISELSLFCNGLLSTCKGVEVILI